MKLAKYFKTDDGSLPEIEVSFNTHAQVAAAFQHLYDRGAVNVTLGPNNVWSRFNHSERPYSGPSDAALVGSREIDPFHVVLRSVCGSDIPVPDLGVFVFPDSLTIDYRMGDGWGEPQIDSLLKLLGQLRLLGGSVSVPWWGVEGESDFLNALGGA
ncbi:MAG: hypothetical protein ABWY06_13005 [Pseudomonas sp.]|uniref:hypothetical protein n=1 Tax=Pseudomonas sp. TaxID=306 RepID=UPI003390E7E0